MLRLVTARTASAWHGFSCHEGNANSLWHPGKMPVGLDFGTTNSSIALAGPNGVEVAKFAYSGGETEAFRSLLYLDRIRENGRSTIKSWGGPAGIDEYLGADEKGRLVQSLKSFLTSRSL